MSGGVTVFTAAKAGYFIKQYQDLLDFQEVSNLRSHKQSRNCSQSKYVLSAVGSLKVDIGRSSETIKKRYILWMACTNISSSFLDEMRDTRNRWNHEQKIIRRTFFIDCRLVFFLVSFFKLFLFFTQVSSLLERK